jgi:hypothetical protein
MLKIARLNGCITVSLLQWWETAKQIKRVFDGGKNNEIFI